MGVRTFVMWCASVLGAVALHANAADAPLPVRGDDAYARWLIRSAIKYSPTTADLVRRLEATNVIAYVTTEAPPGSFAAHTTLAGVTAHARYVRVTLSGDHTSRKMMELLGHELQHVLEIAEHPEVRNADGMLALFTRIGREHLRGHFETRRAKEISDLVRVELARFPPWMLASSAPGRAGGLGLS
jgi:hypothetical protein